MSHGTWESGPESLSPVFYRTLTFCGRPFQTVRLELRLFTLRVRRTEPRPDPTTPSVQRIRAVTHRRFGLFPFRSPLLRESPLLSLPRGTKMFQFPRFASQPYRFRLRCPGMTRDRFPHSGISGSAPVCGFPELFAAYHALHRLLVPRHPPYTLSSLTPYRLSAEKWSNCSRYPFPIHLSKNHR